MPPPDPQAFEWLTTEKAAGLVAIIAAIGAYLFGGRKRAKAEETTAPTAVASMARTNELIEELIMVQRAAGRRELDEDIIRVSLLTQIRDLIRAALGDETFVAAPPPLIPRRRRRAAPKKP